MATRATVKILGSGGSGGIPLAGGYWGRCDPNNPKNHRTRASLSIRTERTSLIIDTGPEFREQSYGHGIDHVDMIAYTHAHTDHVAGFDDIRYLLISEKIMGRDRRLMPVYADKVTLEDLRQRFPYAFHDSADGLYPAIVEGHVLDPEKEADHCFGDIPARLFHQKHGSIRTLGYRFGPLTYSTDVSDLDEEALNIIAGSRIWIVDCGQYGQDIIHVHANLERILEWNKFVKVDKIYLTHLTPRADHDEINHCTPDFIEAAYDGLELIIEL